MQTSRRNQNEKEWQYRSIFDAANDGLIITDLETGLVVEANPAACAMHGYTREEFIGLPLTAFIHPDSQYLFSEYFGRFKQDGVSIDGHSMYAGMAQSFMPNGVGQRSLIKAGPACSVLFVMSVNGLGRTITQPACRNTHP